MQSLEVISVNIWQILISLLNLFILFLILKKFLFKPVKRMEAERSAELEKQYNDAENAEAAAAALKSEWDEKIKTAETAAAEIRRQAKEKAENSADGIIAEAHKKAEEITESAREQARLEHKKDEADLKREIADASVALASKLIGREINPDDHKALIDGAIDGIGEE